MMWPMTGAMALSEHLLGLSVVATPLQRAGLNPIAAYNVCFLLTFALSGFFAYLLGRRLTGSVFAGICAGIAFGFSPYRAQPTGAHPGALVAVDATRAPRSARLSGNGRQAMARRLRCRVVAAGALERLFPAVLSGAGRGVAAWFVDWRRAPGRGLAIVTAWAVASLPLLPVLLKYREVHERLGLTRTVAEIREFSAVPASFLPRRADDEILARGPGGQPRAVSVHGRDGRVARMRRSVLLLARRRAVLADRAPILFYAAATILMWVLALGPGGEKLESGVALSSIRLAALPARLKPGRESSQALQIMGDAGIQLFTAQPE